MKQDNFILGELFYGALFIAFGLGSVLQSILGEKMSNGFIFIILGISLLVVSVIIKYDSKIE